MARPKAIQWKYYMFLLSLIAMTIVLGVSAKVQHNLRISMDKLPEHDIWVMPWYLPAAMSFISAVILAVAIRQKRIV